MSNNSHFEYSYITCHLCFWSESVKKGKPILQIDELQLLHFLQYNGFGRVFHRYEQSIIAYHNRMNGRIFRVSSEQVCDFVWDYVSNLEDEIADSFDKKELQLLLIKKPSLFSRSRLKWLARLDDTSQEGVRHA